ncbi:hypothetical protein COT97_00520 [Candidatus Falkowbacteria bacterium CG10_big_fil_rev_8_21_14_0_10_39_11]|uniref:Uncharacterized protein n=1 Tax=Candidatus Falkowbacteria bacterium CG10_big_fil_rev_8_21_14_0_10_39_11 TaxID=1974565 RepID=A0A2H0V6D1_9BACT|nr:MAG: hypothetical protein COT97_00520 [Candidatus Falkowbacteria bacterium CG10_big_fil_rev_8_21_14_0_10_39_11]
MKLKTWGKSSLMIAILLMMLSMTSCQMEHCAAHLIGMIIGSLLFFWLCCIIPIVGPTIGIVLIIGVWSDDCNNDRSLTQTQCGCSAACDEYDYPQEQKLLYEDEEGPDPVDGTAF